MSTLWRIAKGGLKWAFSSVGGRLFTAINSCWSQLLRWRKQRCCRSSSSTDVVIERTDSVVYRFTVKESSGTS